MGDYRFIKTFCESYIENS